jgi:imidazolonepropionase-like amidohydrolase
MTTNRLLLPVLFAVSVATASEPVPAPKQKRPVALVGGTVHTVSGATLPGATVVFDKGVITAIGVDVVIPPDAERVNVSGNHVYPGLVDANSSMGLTEIESVAGSNDLQETGRINPNIRAEVGVNPESELIPVARSGGVAITATSATGGLISGTAAAMMTDGWTWEEMTLKAPIGLVVNWPTMTYRRPRSGRQTREEWQKQRDAELKTLAETFATARAYMKAREAERSRHDPDLRWEAMIPVLQKKVPIWVNADEVAQIQSAVSWAEQEGVNLVIVGGNDAWRVAGLLKEKKIPVIYTNVLSSPGRRFEPYDLVYSTPAKLAEAGVFFCIAGERSPSFSRNLNHQAATAAAFGLPKDEALKAVTLYAARILGIADRVGSLEQGKDATLMITDGDPLELSTTVLQVYIQGRKADMRDKHKQLYGKYQEKYRQPR